MLFTVCACALCTIFLNVKACAWAEQYTHRIQRSNLQLMVSLLPQTLIAAYGMAGRPEAAEAVFDAMAKTGYAPRDYAYCGLIAAYR